MRGTVLTAGSAGGGGFQQLLGQTAEAVPERLPDLLAGAGQAPSSGQGVANWSVAHAAPDWIPSVLVSLLDQNYTSANCCNSAFLMKLKQPWGALAPMNVIFFSTDSPPLCVVIEFLPGPMFSLMLAPATSKQQCVYRLRISALDPARFQTWIHTCCIC